MLHDLVEKLYAHQDLSFEETRLVFNDLFSGKIDPVVLGSILTALKMNGYKADEIGGAASAMISAAEPFDRDTKVDVGEIADSIAKHKLK